MEWLQHHHHRAIYLHHEKDVGSNRRTDQSRENTRDAMVRGDRTIRIDMGVHHGNPCRFEVSMDATALLRGLLRYLRGGVRNQQALRRRNRQSRLSPHRVRKRSLQAPKGYGLPQPPQALRLAVQMVKNKIDY